MKYMKNKGKSFRFKRREMRLGKERPRVMQAKLNANSMESSSSLVRLRPIRICK